MEQNEQLIQNIEKLLEEARKLADTLGRGKGGRETALVITKLQEAQHWAIETRWQVTRIDN